MEYVIIEKSWSKRRKLDTSKTISNIHIPDLVKSHNHFCKMQVQYEDGTSETLISRVVYNPIKDHYVVDGLKVAIRLL